MDTIGVYGIFQFEIRLFTLILRGRFIQPGSAKPADVFEVHNAVPVYVRTIWAFATRPFDRQRDHIGRVQAF